MSSAASTGIIPRKTITVPRDYPRQAHEDAPRPCSVRGPSEDRREHRKDSSLVMRSFSQNRQARTADGQCQEPGGARVRVSKGPYTERGHEERGRISRGPSERDDRSERTPKAGVDGSPAPREKGLCRPVEKEESAGWEAARSFEAMRAAGLGPYRRSGLMTERRRSWPGSDEKRLRSFRCSGVRTRQEVAPISQVRRSGLVVRVTQSRRGRVSGVIDLSHGPGVCPAYALVGVAG